MSIPPRPELRMRLRLAAGRTMVMGPGRAELLGHIEHQGSIAAAGRQMGMSYKRAWALVEAMNGIFNAPLVQATKGGTGGGGASLTDMGQMVLQAYRGLEASTAKSGAGFIAQLETALQLPPVAEQVPDPIKKRRP